uniref:basic proline-rich protein-like n=1 Tax=Myodes glareolus TaxID=447135 RepID=UPI002021EF48|nr:basic proline-rich protein-like [Myodes glareolus]
MAAFPDCPHSHLLHSNSMAPKLNSSYPSLPNPALGARRSHGAVTRRPSQHSEPSLPPRLRLGPSARGLLTWTPPIRSRLGALALPAPAPGRGRVPAASRPHPLDPLWPGPPLALLSPLPPGTAATSARPPEVGPGQPLPPHIPPIGLALAGPSSPPTPPREHGRWVCTLEPVLQCWRGRTRRWRSTQSTIPQ